jgi:hypothetical protein
VCSRLPKHHELSQHQQQSYHLHSQDQNHYYRYYHSQLEAQYATGNWVFAIRIDGGDTKSNAAAVSYTIAEGVSLVVEGNKPKDGDSATLAKLTYEF